MGIDSLNIQNKALIQAAMLKKQGGTSTTSKNPQTIAMSREGSIFNLVNSNNTQRTAPKGDLANLNTLRSIQDLNNQRNANKAKPSDSNASTKVGSASEGKAKAAAVKKEAESLQDRTRQVQQYRTTTSSYAAEAQKSEKSTKLDEKAFSTRQKQEAYELKETNNKIARMIQQQEEDQRAVNDAQRELDSLTSSSTNSRSGNNSKIQELQQFIGSKVSGMQQNGRVIYSLQRNQTRTLRSMNKSNAQFIKAQNRSISAMKQKESAADKIINIATKAEQISQMVTASGQVLKTLGTAMIAAATLPWTAWMAPVGQVMAKVGTTAEMVGNYGSTAANLTKTGAYAAQGNLQGAIQSAASAAMTGTAAIKQTKNLKSDFGKINDQAKDVNITREANAEAKKQVKNARKAAMAELAAEHLRGAGVSKEDALEQFKDWSEKDLSDALKYARKEQPDIFGLDAKGKALNLNDVINEQAFGTDSNGNAINAGQARRATSAVIQNALRSDATLKSRNNAHAQAHDVRDNISRTQSGAFDAAKNYENGAFTNTVDNSLKKSSVSLGSSLQSSLKGFNGAAAMFGQQGGFGTNPYGTNPYGTNPTGSRSSRSRSNENDGVIRGRNDANRRIAARRAARREARRA